MIVPTSTYRFQLTPARGFPALGELAGYLATLGVGDAYLSPILQATPGSTHGYDVVDHGNINYELGGEPEFLRAAEALREAGVGIVVDVVPNHMALPVPEHLNAAFWSVLRDGTDSPTASWFDIDWGMDQPIVLPVLGRRIAECLDEGEIVVERQGGPDGRPVVRYFDHVFPVRPGTEDLDLEELLDRQHYQLAFWRTADDELNYRRFFDVDTLLGFRVEEPEVFDSSHSLIVGLVRDGIVSGLRIDHPDGLADPRAYLRQLGAATHEAWVVVEKILEGEEDLPADWLCAGTTGYESLLRIGGLFVDPSGEPTLRTAFADLGLPGEPATLPWDEVQEEARRLALGRMLSPEVDRLAGLGYEICQSKVRLRDFSRRGLFEALVEMLVAIPVYRAYVVPGEDPPVTSVDILESTAARAVERLPERTAEIELVRDLALMRLGRGPLQDEFCQRFQQTSGPAVAKGIEDTAFYRWFPLAALNEVGGQPDRFGVTPDEFHAWAQARQLRWPNSLTTLSTHDTKRSEDVRARLSVISEVPDTWLDAVTQLHQRLGVLTTPDAITDGATDWLMWQTAVGAWPIDADRLSAYLLKATREAKLHTSWRVQDPAYEEHLSAAVHDRLSDSEVQRIIGAVVDDLHPGFVANALGQRAIQLLAPGVPDIYQGCEAVSLRLVDPDNRVPPTAEVLEGLLTTALGGVPDPYADLDAAKLRLTALGLHLRRDHPEMVGADGGYEPLPVEGPLADHVVGFSRGAGLAVTATRLAMRLSEAGGWDDATTVVLPEGTWRDVLTAREHEGARALPVAHLHATWPVTLLERMS
jgi:(1->4)-alpha-D-glucan 1-alpha-D-glucosylmutase